jgi:hypothetical protein
MPFGFTARPSHNRETPDNKIAFQMSQVLSESMTLHNTNPIKVY